MKVEILQDTTSLESNT